MQCGPGTVLQPDQQAHVLRCPRCGIERRLPGRPLFVVTGASGAGKSTIVEPLRRRLPGYEVFEADVLLHVAALAWDTWRNTCDTSTLSADEVADRVAGWGPAAARPRRVRRLRQHPCDPCHGLLTRRPGPAVRLRGARAWASLMSRNQLRSPSTAGAAVTGTAIPCAWLTVLSVLSR